MVAKENAKEPLLERLGDRVRTLRQGLGLTRVALAEAANLSVRYLAELEGGAGNISVLRLEKIGESLGESAASLLAAAEAPGLSGVVTLLGLRGAGKSTLGPLLAERLSVPFMELDPIVEQAAGMSLAQLFELHGERYYRRLERETLARFLVENRRAVLATGGGIVTEPETLDLLSRNTVTVWLRADAREHWDRVVAQGDRRPMENRAQAMDELRALLDSRQPLYERARLKVDTSELTVDGAVDQIVAAVGTPALKQLELGSDRS